MATFSIESELFLGMSHSGSVTINGESKVELLDEEVEILIKLIREKNSADVYDLELEKLHPQIFEKLREAYFKLAYDEEEMHWLWEGYNNGNFEYDHEELKNYCKQNCGFSFEFSELDYLTEQGEFNEDCFCEDEEDAFNEWLDDYLLGMTDQEQRNFFYDHMHADLVLDDVEYSVEIPEAIIKKAKQAYVRKTS